MRGDDLVLDSKVIECENVLSGATLERIQVLDLEVVFGPFEFKARSISHKSFQVRLIEQIVDSFFIDLKVRAVNCEFLPSGPALLLNHFKEESDRSWTYTFVFTGFDHRDRLAFFVLTILVALHRKGFSRASLAIGENRRIVTLYETANVKSEF